MQALLENLIPLYLLIGAGYIAGRWLDVNLHSVTRIVMFILMPVTFFGAGVNADIRVEYLALPFITSICSFAIALSALKIGKKIWSNGLEYSLSSASVNANAVYFGLPLIIALFGEEGAALYLFMNLGGAINNVSLGYYISARGRFSVKDSLMKLAKFPTFYAIAIGLLLNVMDYEMPEVAEKYWRYSAGAMTILGMMMVGISVSKLKGLQIHWGHLTALFITKYIAWPAALGAFVLLDLYALHLFDNQIYAMMLLLSVMPLFANYVSYAAEHDLYPQQAGSAVLISSFFSVIIIPAMYYLLTYIGWVPHG